MRLNLKITRYLTFILLSTFFIAARSSPYEPTNSRFVLDVLNTKDKLQIEQLFKEFQERYKRNYKTPEEYENRLKIFKENLLKIDYLNRNELGSALYDINEFADLNIAEFKSGYAKFVPRAKQNVNKFSANKLINSDFPEKFDWRDKGVITKIKHQGYLCGTCWAHAAVGNIESQYAIQTGKLVELSEQQLVDCDKSNNACLGGYPIKAYQTIIEMGGLAKAADYPYIADNHTCYFQRTMASVKIKDHVLLPKNETIMQKWLVAMGPISIGINFTPWQFYSHGVIKMNAEICTPTKLNHAALIVGYGYETTKTLKRIPYWIVKNSYGEMWGEAGYARIYRGENVCGIGEEPTTAILED